MKNVWFILIFLLFAGLLGCQQESPVTETPAAPAIATLPLQAGSTTLVTLVRNPSFFEGNYLQLSGQYKRLPLPVCTEEGHFSPATWALTDGQTEVLASGFDDILRQLAGTGMPIVVEGRWQQWEGLVGCGRRAPVEQIWYVEVSNIISPNPLTAAEGETEGIASLPSLSTPGAGGDAGSTAGETGDPNITATAFQVPTQTPLGLTVPTASPTALATAPSTSAPFSTASATAVLAGAATSSPAATATRTRTPTPSPTGPAGTATQTPAPVNTSVGLPTATGEATPGTTITIEYDDLVKSSLNNRTIDLWNFVGDPGDVVTIGVAPVPDLDVSVELTDPNGNVLVTQNQAGSGGTENINQRTLNMSGVYEITVQAVGNGSGEYALVLQNTESVPFMIFQGNMSYGDSRSNTATTDIDDQWNFQGTAGEVVTIRAVAMGSEDLVLYLNDPDALEVEFSDDDTTTGPPNDEELISRYTLMKTGMYTIGVGEGDFNPYGYTLTLVRES